MGGSLAYILFPATLQLPFVFQRDLDRDHTPGLRGPRKMRDIAHMQTEESALEQENDLDVLVVNVGSENKVYPFAS